MIIRILIIDRVLEKLELYPPEPTYRRFNVALCKLKLECLGHSVSVFIMLPFGKHLVTMLFSNGHLHTTNALSHFFGFHKFNSVAGMLLSLILPYASRRFCTTIVSISLLESITVVMITYHCARHEHYHLSVRINLYLLFYFIFHRSHYVMRFSSFRSFHCYGSLCFDSNKR